MKSMYNALLRFIMLPVVLNVSATSGMAERIAVEEIGARRPARLNTVVMITFR